MLFHKKVIVILVAQSSAFLARAFVTPSPFGLSTPKSCSIAAGPLLVSAVEDESAEAIVEETEAVLEIPKVPESDAAEELSGDAVASDETAAARKERLSVFVGNLPFQTTNVEVRDLFAEFGTVELVSVPRNRETGQARGFAFVDMATREELDKAIAGVNGLMYGGRTIRVAESLPKDRVNKETARKVAPDVGARKIYVGNLSFDTDKESLIEFYSQYGTVKDIYIPLDVGTGRGRGFAFVTMAEEDVDRAIQNTNGAEFMGRLLAVSIPLPRGTKVSPRPGKEENKSGTKLYVGNLSFYTTLDAIQELFGEYGQVMDCYLPQDRESGGSRGFAFVTLDHEGAMRAMEETDGYELDGRIIRVNEAEPRGLTSGRNNYYDDDEGGEEYSDNDASEY